MATITKDLVEELELSFEVREDYSGRGMYGKTCFAIVSDLGSWDLRNEFEELKEDLGDEELLDELGTLMSRAPRTDSMGMSTVYYWPTIQVEKE